MSSVAIIPARGGSKRLPRKNILEVCGKPLLGWVVGSVVDSGVFDSVIVSSEDDEILSVAENFGAEIHVRENRLATDTARVVDVCLDVLQQYEFDNFCCVYPTASLITKDIFRQSFNVFESTKCDVMMSVGTYNFSPFEALIESENGTLKMLHEEYKGVQSQRFPKVCVDAGAFYWARSSVFIQEKTFYPSNLKGYPLDSRFFCDLDTKKDLDELLVKMHERVSSFQG